MWNGKCNIQYVPTCRYIYLDTTYNCYLQVVADVAAPLGQGTKGLWTIFFLFILKMGWLNRTWKSLPFILLVLRKNWTELESIYTKEQLEIFIGKNMGNFLYTVIITIMFTSQIVHLWTGVRV